MSWEICTFSRDQLDVFNGYGYFYLRLYRTCLGFQANIVEECVVECVAAHLRGFEEDSRSEVVFWIDELSIKFGYHWLMLLIVLTAHLFQFRFAVTVQYWHSCGTVERSTEFSHHWFRVPRVHHATSLMCLSLVFL